MEASAVGENGSSSRDRDLPPNPLGGAYRQCFGNARFGSSCAKSPLVRHAALRAGRVEQFVGSAYDGSEGDGELKLEESLSQVNMELESIEELEIPQIKEDSESDFIPVVRSGGWADIGFRKTMEDAYVCFDDFLHDCKHLGFPSAFYGVFDGHGGKYAASFVCDNLPRLILEDADFPREIEKVVAAAFLRTDNAFAEACSLDATLASGTTALTAVIVGRKQVRKMKPMETGSLVVANAGDCRAVLCRRGKAIEMSRDHKPGSMREMKRIEASGGYVSDGYLNGQLNVARALGDWHMEGLKIPANGGGPNLGPLSGEPEMMRVNLTEEDEFLIIGCDGIWDVFRSQNAVDFARRKLQQHNDPLTCCKELVSEALKRNSGDNLAVVVVCLQAKPPPNLSAPRPHVHRSISAEGLRELQSFLDSLRT